MPMNPALAELLAKGKKPATPAPEPVEDKTAELKATVAALQTASAGDKVNPPESAEALQASLEPAPVEGAKPRGRAAKAATKTPTAPKNEDVPGEFATGEIEFVDTREGGYSIHVKTQTWPTSRKVKLVFE